MNLEHLKLHRHRRAGGATFGDVTYPPGGALGPRVQHDVQLVVVLEGWAEIAVDGVQGRLEAGEARLLLPGHSENFRFAPNVETHHTWCALTPERVPSELLDSLERLSQPIALTPRLHALLEGGLDFPPNVALEGGQVLEQWALLLLHTLVFEVAAGSSAHSFPAALERTLLFIETHLNETLTLERVARAAGVTPQHLTRLFRRHFETSPMRYVWALRVKKGVDLLGSTGLSITAIAERLGFASPFHFSKLVRERYGDSPRALRKAAWRGFEVPPTHLA